MRRCPHCKTIYAALRSSGYHEDYKTRCEFCGFAYVWSTWGKVDDEVGDIMGADDKIFGGKTDLNVTIRKLLKIKCKLQIENKELRILVEEFISNHNYHVHLEICKKASDILYVCKKKPGEKYE